MQKVDRFYISVADIRDEAGAIRIGLAWLQDRVELDNAAQAVLATLTRRQIESGTIFARALGEDIASCLHKGKTVPIGHAQLVLITELKTKWPSFPSPTPVLCVYTSEKQLNELDKATNVSAICLVLFPDYDQGWVDSWNPIDLRTGRPHHEETETALDPVVQEALRSLAINPSTSPLGHPSDRARCIWAFKRLKAARVHYDPDQIQAFLVSKLGWTLKYAAQVRDIAKGVSEGRRFQAQEHWPPDIVKQWKQRAAERSTNS